MRVATFLLIGLVACHASPDATADAGAHSAEPYTDTVFDSIRITSDSSKPNFQQASTTVSIHDGPFASVKLVIDLGTTCYPFDNWPQDPPPMGQNWPADCDAFDRNFDFTFDAAQQMGDPPGFNVVHAITPFGGPEHLEEDITDLANALPGMHRLRVVIPTWSDGAGKVSGSDGGWNVTAKIVAIPGAPPRKVLAAIPLFEGSSPIHSMEIPFTVPDGTATARLEMRASGHGGAQGDGDCIGPADEFCHRSLSVDIDDQALAPIDPWRTDCDQLCMIMHQGSASSGFDYCQQNPCGSIDSVKAPRANWCPGSETPPFVWDTDALHVAGTHRLAWDFSTIATGGEWAISAIYYAYAE